MGIGWTVSGSRVNEGNIPGSKEIKPLDETNLKHMSKYICKLNGKEKIGTGFFCKIPYKNEIIPVLITNYHVIDDDFLKGKKNLKVYINGIFHLIKIDKNSKIYSSEDYNYDIIIIKIREVDEINYFLEIDENIFQPNSETSYKDEPIYILHYPNCEKASVSHGTGLEKIDDYNIRHFCNTEAGSSGAPILSLLTNKIIGIHKAYIKKGYNIGTFLKFPLSEINGKIPAIEKKLNDNEILITLRVDKNDINHKIYFLCDWVGHFSYEKPKELNEFNTNLYINNKKQKYKNHFTPFEEGIYSIKLKFNILIKDCSYMFFSCDKIIYIDLSSFNTKNITNMEGMFSNCLSLKYIKGLSNWNIQKVLTMANMFYNCKSLKSLSDISGWNTENVKNISSMFAFCNSLEYLPDISRWKISKDIEFFGMFYQCSSLKSFPDISKWNIYIDDIWREFLPEISWEGTKFTIIKELMLLDPESFEYL